MTQLQDETEVVRELQSKGWTPVGIGALWPPIGFTVDAHGPDGYEIRVDPNQDHNGPMLCQVRDAVTKVTRLFDGIPDAREVGRLMKEYEDILRAAWIARIRTEMGGYDYIAKDWHVFDLESGKVVPENLEDRK